MRLEVLARMVSYSFSEEARCPGESDLAPAIRLLAGVARSSRAARDGALASRS